MRKLILSASLLLTAACASRTYYVGPVYDSLGRPYAYTPYGVRYMDPATTPPVYYAPAVAYPYPGQYVCPSCGSMAEVPSTCANCQQPRGTN